MAFSELVKSFEKIRGYMREFYVYGFRTRSGFSGKSGRTYDNERRRLECVSTPKAPGILAVKMFSCQ